MCWMTLSAKSVEPGAAEPARRARRAKNQYLSRRLFGAACNDGVSGENQGMLIPRFSLRLMLGVTTASACFFYLVMRAMRGQHWALGTSIAIGSLLLAMLLHVFFFGLAWLLSLILRPFQSQPIRSSPFAAAGPPEQVIPPTNPE